MPTTVALLHDLNRLEFRKERGPVGTGQWWALLVDEAQLLIHGFRLLQRLWNGHEEADQSEHSSASRLRMRARTLTPRTRQHHLRHCLQGLALTAAPPRVMDKNRSRSYIITHPHD